MRRRLRRQNAKKLRHRDAGGKRIAAGAGLSLAAVLAAPAAAQAVPFDVTTNLDEVDDGECVLDCTLREAIGRANAVGTADEITFQAGVTGTITLSSGVLSVADDLTITGPGAGTLTVSGNDTTRILALPAGVVYHDLTISGLTLADGNAGSYGGAVFQPGPGTVTITNSTLSGNDTSDTGGAIYAFRGVTIQNSTVSGNTSGGSGGAVHSSNGPVTVQDSTFTDNHAYAAGGGGAIVQSAGNLLVEDSTLSGNTAFRGGAVHGLNSDELTIRRSTLHDNTAAEHGGGIYTNSADILTVESSTISGNTSTGAQGAGIYALRAPLVVRASTVSGNIAATGSGAGIQHAVYYSADSETIESSTIAGNTAPGGIGGGVRHIIEPMSTAPAPTITNSIVADNFAPTGPNLAGSFNASFSLFESTSGAIITETVPGSNITGQDPALGVLGPNGGTTAKPAGRPPAAP